MSDLAAKLRDTGERILTSGGPGFEVYGERAVVFAALLINAAKALEARAPEGWKLVPVEPTEAMLDQVDEPIAVIACWWEEMLAAAPNPPHSEGTAK